MPLIENTLFGDVDKVQVALERLKQYEPKEGYWVGISGGKDSTVIHDLVKKAKVKHEFHYSSTTIDPPQVIQHLRKHQPDVQIDLPEVPFFKYMRMKAKVPPTRKIRWCCDIYKERGGHGNLVVTGIRWEESANRRDRKVYEKCKRHKKTWYLHPIIDWTEMEVWEYIEKNNLPYNELYDEPYNLDRIGCVLCPMVRDIERHKKYFPKIYNAWKRAVMRSWQSRKDKGLPVFQEKPIDYWNWWIDRDASPVNKSQINMFE